MKKEDMEVPVKHKMTLWDYAFHICNYFLFGVFTLICAYPFYYLIINSISANDLSAAGDINFLPKSIQFQNYIEVFKLSGLSYAVLVSVGRTVLGAACTVLASAFLGFMFTQEKMWHRKLWYRVIVITMYFNAGLIPMFMTMKNLHLTNTFWVYIIPAIVQPFNIIMVKTYVESIPPSLFEAAEIVVEEWFIVLTRNCIPCSICFIHTLTRQVHLQPLLNQVVQCRQLPILPHSRHQHQYV